MYRVRFTIIFMGCPSVHGLGGDVFFYFYTRLKRGELGATLFHASLGVVSMGTSPCSGWILAGK